MFFFDFEVMAGTSGYGGRCGHFLINSGRSWLSVTPGEISKSYDIWSISQRSLPYQNDHAIVNLLRVVNLLLQSDLLSRPPVCGHHFLLFRSISPFKGGFTT